jgi:hypothetical protein
MVIRFYTIVLDYCIIIRQAIMKYQNTIDREKNNYWVRVLLGGQTQFDGSWIFNDCATKRSDETTSIVLDEDNSIHHEHIRDACKSDVSPNTPPADVADLNILFHLTQYELQIRS